MLSSLGATCLCGTRLRRSGETSASRLGIRTGLPTHAGSKSLDTEPAMPVMAPVSQTNHPFQAHDAPVVQVVSGQEVRVVLEVAQKPAKFPQRPVMVIEARACEATRIGGRFQNQERGRPAGLRSVAKLTYHI